MNKQSKECHSKKGIAPIMIMIVILVGMLIGYIAYVGMYGEPNGLVDKYSNKETMEDTSDPPSAEEPVSDSTDMETMEAELEATITGSPEEAIEAMEKEASEL